MYAMQLNVIEVNHETDNLHFFLIVKANKIIEYNSIRYYTVIDNILYFIFTSLRQRFPTKICLA